MTSKTARTFHVSQLGTPRWIGGMFSLWLLGVPLLSSAAGGSYDETRVFGIANFGGANQCGAPSMTHSVHTDTAAAFLDEFTRRVAKGLWGDVETVNNTKARAKYFTDFSQQLWGSDTETYYGVDDGDIIFVHTHGGHGANESSLVMGSNERGCEIDTKQHMRLGNQIGDLEIAVIKACQSGDYDVWRRNKYLDMVTADSEFTMWNAFHGDSSCGSHVTSYVKNYSQLSFDDGVGENWIDLAYAQSSYDDCPVSIVFGETQTKRDSMYEYGGFSDRQNTGNKINSSIYFVSECSPDSGSRLPKK